MRRGFSAIYVFTIFLLIAVVIFIAYLFKIQCPEGTVQTGVGCRGLGVINEIPSAIPEAETGDWKTYSNLEFSYSLNYPPEYDVSNAGKNDSSIAKVNNEPGAGPSNFIYISVFPTGFQSDGGEIYNYNSKEAAVLLGLKVGENKSLREGFDNPKLEKYFSYTRLPDTKIGNLNAKAYVNLDPWGFPDETKEFRYFIEKGANTYMIGGYVEGDVPHYYISEKEFQQILYTFEFTN